uniref:Uncharacterized protein n=2 Tax=Tetradesmus obliquus TaxID=3088 RepID=A0A383VU18_TETOB|eukprot:jgi/Sobl393_1/9095/SZX68987.1
MHAAVVCLATAIAQLGLTVAILVLVRYQLQGLSTVTVDGKLVVAETCYLTLPGDWPAACIYADVAACVSIAIMFAYFVLQLCATLRASRTNRSTASKLAPQRLHIAQVLVLLLGTVSWLAAASTLQHFSARANAAGLAHAPQRAAVLACCWGSLGLFALLLAGELLPTALANIKASSGLPLQQQQQQHQQCLQQPPGLQLGLSVYSTASAAAAAAAAAAGRSHMSPPASFSAPPGLLHNNGRQQQGIVVGIPCAPAAPVRSAQSMPQLLPPPGEGPGSFQMALLSGRGSFAAGSSSSSSHVMRMPSLQPPPAAVWGTAAGGRIANDSQSVAGRVVVVNRSV